MKKNKILPTVTSIVAVTVVSCAIYIAVMRLGLVEGYDFGSGAYYYADIPGFEKLSGDEAYRSTVPLWVHIVLFLGWGWLMWKLWIWIDRK